MRCNAHHKPERTSIAVATTYTPPTSVQLSTAKDLVTIGLKYSISMIRTDWTVCSCHACKHPKTLSLTYVHSMGDVHRGTHPVEGGRQLHLQLASATQLLLGRVGQRRVSVHALAQLLLQHAVELVLTRIQVPHLGRGNDKWRTTRGVPALA